MAEGVGRFGSVDRSMHACRNLYVNISATYGVFQWGKLCGRVLHDGARSAFAVIALRLHAAQRQRRRIQLNWTTRCHHYPPKSKEKDRYPWRPASSPRVSPGTVRAQRHTHASRITKPRNDDTTGLPVGTDTHLSHWDSVGLPGRFLASPACHSARRSLRSSCPAKPRPHPRLRGWNVTLSRQ